MTVRQKDGISPLVIASKNRHSRICKLLLDSCADTEDNNAGATPMYVSATEGDLKGVQMLIDMGADIDSKGPEGKTVVFWATEQKNYDVLRYFLDNGANPNLCDVHQTAPIHIAVHNRDPKAAKMLLDAGCSLEARDRSLMTPLHNAFDLKDWELMQLFVHRGADVNAQSSMGWTPVTIAAIDRDLRALRLLAKKKANFTMVDNLGLRPNDYYMTGNEDEEPLYQVLPEAYLDEDGNFLYKDKPPPLPDDRPRRLDEIVRKKRLEAEEDARGIEAPLHNGDSIDFLNGKR